MSHSLINFDSDSNSDSENILLRSLDNTTENELINHFSNLNINIDTMTQREFKMEYLQIIPQFSGNQAMLAEFIDTSELFITNFYNANNVNDYQNILLLKSIKNKIIGEAANRIASYKIEVWADLKNALINTYADKRDLQSLIIELCQLYQGRLKPLEFFAKVQENLNLQTAYINMHNGANAALIENSQKLALRIFLKNLNGPLGDYLSTRKPNDLNEALHILTNDFNINDKMHFTENNSQPITQNPNFSNSPKTMEFKANPRQFYFQSPANANAFSQQNQSSKFSTNVFNPKPNFKPQPKPTPMSISTRNTSNFKNHPNFNLISENEHIPNAEEEEYYAEVNDPRIYNDFAQTDEADNFLEYEASEINRYNY